ELRHSAFVARRAGAELLEVRGDPRAQPLDLRPAARVLPLLVAERGTPLSRAWVEAARLVDREPVGSSLVSLHAPRPLSTDEAMRVWNLDVGSAHVKHVEPLGDLKTVGRLFETQARLIARFGPERVTVLATGPMALPFRALLARRNALDYLAFSPTWAAAPGQRLLADAVREHRAGAPAKRRLGILGHQVAHSRSPSIHPQPFDRIELPPDAPVGELLDALHPHYAGFAVTSPFKGPVARHVGASLDAVNTLARTPRGWAWENTDVEGAQAALRKLHAKTVTVLGNGGAAVAVRLAAERLGVTLEFCAQRDAREVTGAALWTWPPHVSPPAALTFAGGPVAVIAYGEPARVVGRRIRERGGVPVFTGARWFVTQARAQRKLWEKAT
ncbi:MAG: shikimate dehydrogenase, partial [Myxococcaceae bacterium]|nr:shikimate dehydrogenase [Myxococcaceae bacterium]